LNPLTVVLYGVLFAVGGILTLLATFFVCYRLGLRSKDFPRTKEALEDARAGRKAAGTPAVDLKLLTDSELRQRVLRAAMELDLWVRAATVRGMMVDAELIQRDEGTPEVPLPRPVFKLRVHSREEPAT